MAGKGSSTSLDRVEYRLFPIIPQGLSEQEEHSYLEEQLDLFVAQLGCHLVDYIWQNEAFRLRIVPKSGSLTLRLLCSETKQEY